MVDVLDDIERPFLPMLISNWVFGIGIIEIPFRKPHRILSFIYTLLILIIYMILVCIGYPHCLLTWMAQKRPTTEKFFFLVNILVTISVYISGWFQVQGLHRCMEKAALANHLMEKIGIPKEYSKILKRELIKCLIFFVFILLVIWINSFISEVAEDVEIVVVFVQAFSLVIAFIADASFMNILGYANFKFKKLNDALKNLLTSTPNSPLHRRIAKQAIRDDMHPRNDSSEINSKDYTFEIRTAKLAHLRLIKLCREVNRIYGLHNLLSITVAFIEIVNNIFNFYICITIDLAAIQKAKEFIRSLNWFMYFCFKTIAICSLCNDVCKSAVKTGDLISELYDEPLINEATKTEIRYFNIELIQNKLKFSAYGFVQIDLTLIQFMISAIGTYVIIMIQFKKIKFESTVDNEDKVVQNDYMNYYFNWFSKDNN